MFIRFFFSSSVQSPEFKQVLTLCGDTTKLIIIVKKKKFCAIAKTHFAYCVRTNCVYARELPKIVFVLMQENKKSLVL